MTSVFDLWKSFQAFSRSQFLRQITFLFRRSIISCKEVLGQPGSGRLWRGSWEPKRGLLLDGFCLRLSSGSCNTSGQPPKTSFVGHGSHHTFYCGGTPLLALRWQFFPRACLVLPPSSIRVFTEASFWGVGSVCGCPHFHGPLVCQRNSSSYLGDESH